MHLTDEIETAEARAQRSRRRRFAAPGGSHDRLVRLLAAALPMGIGVMAALMIISPFTPRGEVSFLLDRDKARQIEERLRVDNAMYRGQDNSGRPFSLTAGEAVQQSSAEGIVWLRDMVARIILPEGPARLSADGGQYILRSERVEVAGPVRLEAADGYRMTASGVALDLPAKRMVGSGGVSGAVPAGTFSADRIAVDMEARTVTLDGNARLSMIPGRLGTM